jgi:pimeloyl-ACP methyl ester carboxylesterase
VSAIAVFAHANGYPPASYRALLALLSPELEVKAIEHRPLWCDESAPTFLSWQVYADDLIERIEACAPGPIWVIGHSMGAASAVLAAAKRPDLFLGIVGLDPVLIPSSTWFWALLFNRLKPNGMPIIAKALSRPHCFEGHETAFAFYRTKRVFADVRDEVLMDYVLAAHEPVADGGVHLRHSGAWEACIYRSVPRMDSALRRLTCPMLILAGDTSNVLSAERLRWVTGLNAVITSKVMQGGHLLPLERPEECADEILRCIVREAC